MRTCKQCLTSKPLDSFRKRSNYPLLRYKTCKTCESAYRTAHRSPLETERQRTQRYRNRHRAYFLIRYARERAAEYGWDFDLSEHRQEIQKRIDAGRCELTGAPFNLHGSRACNSPSLDRIDSNKGYTYDNIRVICFAMNSALGNWGEEALLAVVTSWLRKRRRESSAKETGGSTQSKNQHALLGAV